MKIQSICEKIIKDNKKIIRMLIIVALLLFATVAMTWVKMFM